MTKWKYMTAQFVTTGLGDQAAVEKVQENMTALGLYGWELVSTNVYHNHDIGQDVLIMFFKKPIVEDVLTTPRPVGGSVAKPVTLPNPKSQPGR